MPAATTFTPRWAWGWRGCWHPWRISCVPGCGCCSSRLRKQPKAPVGWWKPVLWLALAVPLFFGWALLRYHAMRVAADVSWVAIRKGVVRRQTWFVPIDKLQTAGWHANWFQRRLGLVSIYVDTAGASPGRSAALPDMEEGPAQELISRVYALFKHSSDERRS